MTGFKFYKGHTHTECVIVQPGIDYLVRESAFWGDNGMLMCDSLCSVCLPYFNNVVTFS